MMTSSSTLTEAYVWIWLPNESEPVVAGKCTAEGHVLQFNYGQSYLSNKNAIALFDKELPLKAGIQSPLPGLSIPGCIRDSAPDAWGRRVIINKLLGIKGNNADPVALSELTYLLESGSDRIGALDFQQSPFDYVPRTIEYATLDELQHSAERVEKGIPLTSALDQALHHGSSIGGARPKALIQQNEIRYIAKFSSSTDIYNICKSEFIAMRLAKLCGLNVANVKLTQSSHKDVLLVERFDRVYQNQNTSKRHLLSALTLLQLDEMMARYASYETFAEIIRHRFANPTTTLKELYSRLVFNILCGNTDDHARNQAAFWDGETLTLSPAYDICPQNRTGGEATQAMLINNNDRMSKISSCLLAAHIFLLSSDEAKAIIEHQLECIGEHWQAVCAEAKTSEIEQRFLWGRQFLNPSVFVSLTGKNISLKTLADAIRQQLCI